MAAPLAWTNCC